MNKNNEKISILIVDDHPMVIDGLTACLSYYDDMHVVGQASNGKDGIQQCLALKPDVLIKGADWLEESIVGSGFVKANGGTVVRISLVPEVSTSQIIEKILELHGQD